MDSASIAKRLPSSTPMDGASIAKRLASCNTTARNRAVRLLASWLSHNPSGDSSTAAVAVVSDGDLSRIWKGLFYCVWHADKLPAQLDLINRLASLLSALDRPLAVRYLDAFIVTVRREWSGIDHLRLDKFYLLIRRFLRHLFLLLSNTSWDPELSAQTIAVLSEKSLLAVDKSQGNGVSYFIAEAFLDEMSEFLPVPPETLEVLLSPFILATERSTDKVLLSKIKVSIFDRLLENGAKLLVLERSGGHAEPGSEVEKLGKIAFLMGFSKRFFDSGSAAETLQGNRKAFFALHHSFLKLEKGLEKSGVSISIEGPENGNLVNVPPVSVASDSSEQIEADSGRGGGGSDGKPAKKRKKPKKSNGNPTEGADSVVSENSEQIETGSGYIGVKSDGKPEKKRKKLRKSSGNLKEGLDSVVLESSELIKTGSGCGGKEQDDNPSKKKKKAKKSLASVEKKSKTKKNMSGSDKEGSVAVPLDGSDYIKGDLTDAHGLIPLDKHVMSNLQKQFEKVASESGMANSDVTLPHPSSTPVATMPTNKRKSGDRKNTVSPSSVNGGRSITKKSGDKSAKKVRFSMKNNIVWKPQTPLPPQSLRLPPSATPRGSALKQGVPPGPVKETPLSMIRGKAMSRSIKKGLKGSNSVSPAIKRLRKLQCFSV